MKVTNVGRILSLQDVADRTGISVNTLRHYRTTGRGGPRTFRVGRRVMVREDDLESWLSDLYAAENAEGA